MCSAWDSENKADDRGGLHLMHVCGVCVIKEDVLISQPGKDPAKGVMVTNGVRYVNQSW